MSSIRLPQIMKGKRPGARFFLLHRETKIEPMRLKAAKQVDRAKMCNLEGGFEDTMNSEYSRLVADVLAVFSVDELGDLVREIEERTGFNRCKKLA